VIKFVSDLQQVGGILWMIDISLYDLEKVVFFSVHLKNMKQNLYKIIVFSLRFDG
jgi:hypothetical protein